MQVTHDTFWHADAWLVSRGFYCCDCYETFFEPIPSAPGIYCLTVMTDPDWARKGDPSLKAVAYVGKSKNLSFRINRSHEVLVKLRAHFGYVQRWHKTLTEPEIHDAELAEIKFWCPPFNVMHNDPFALIQRGEAHNA